LKFIFDNTPLCRCIERFAVVVAVSSLGAGWIFLDEKSTL